MLSLVIYAAPFVLGLVALIVAIAAFSNFRRARRAPYFRIRRDSNRTAWRLVLAEVMLVGSILALISLRRFVPPADLETFLIPRSTITPTASSTLAAEASVEPTSAPPTITPTQPTPTPTPTPLIATIASDVTPPASARLTLTDVASGISPNLTPINASRTFPIGTPRLYFFIEFSGMANGVSWSRVLLLNGEAVRSESETWERGEQGEAYYWFEAQGGWPAGRYEIRLYLGNQLADSAEFEVVD